MSKMNCCKVVIMFVLLSMIAVSNGFAAQPHKYHVGTLVFTDFSTTLSHLIQFPGSPVDCTDNFQSDWCMWVSCDTILSSTYDCTSIPMVHTCLAFQISGTEIIKVINCDSDGCK